MIAYFSPGAPCRGPAWEIPAFARVLSAGPWLACPSTQCGKSGALIWSKGFDQPVPNFEEARWRSCSDGLLYLPPSVMPTQADLVRTERRMPSIDVMTSRGVQLSIPLALAAPRLVSFSAAKLTDPADEFGSKAQLVFDLIAEGTKDKSKAINGSDPRVIDLVLIAVQQFYRVTAELLDDLRWISSADIDPILCAIMGSDPKALEAAGGSSPSPAAA